MVLAPVGFWQL